MFLEIDEMRLFKKDSVTVTVDAVIYFKIFDPVLSVNRVADAQFSTRLLAATTLRNILGTKTLQEILQDKESLSQNMQHILDVATDDWYFMVIFKKSHNSFNPICCFSRGVKVERVEVYVIYMEINQKLKYSICCV